MASKISSLARIFSLLSIVSAIAILIWDAVKGCTCHCYWVFALLLAGSVVLFVIWLNDMIGSDNKENKRIYDEISKSGGYKAPSKSKKQ